MKLTGKNKVEVSMIGKTADPDPGSTSDALKEKMIQSMKDAQNAVTAVSDLGFRAEDARAIGLNLFIART